jgi:hypothetical protein
MASLDALYIGWVRRQVCACCGAPAPSHAHHHTSAPTYSPGLPPAKSAGRKRGKAQKASDYYTLPLCLKCHGWLHDNRGFFSGYQHDELRAWQDTQVQQHHERFDAELEAKGEVPDEPHLAPVPSSLDVFDVEGAASNWLAVYEGQRGPQVHHELVRLIRAAMRAVKEGRAA